jgi:hypothetical protein
MKKIKSLFFLTLFTTLVIGCQDDNSGFPSSNVPDLVVASTEIYGTPNQNINIEAEITDDLGLKTVRIQIPELSLDKIISFKTEPLVTDYDLNYSFKIPAEAKTSETFKVFLTVTDVSGNAKDKEIDLRLDGDLKGPTINIITPSEGAQIVVTTKKELAINLMINDDSKIDYFEVKCDALGIYDKIESINTAQRTYNKTFTLPSILPSKASYTITITAVDKFLVPNTSTLNVTILVTNEYETLYLCDLPKGSDLTSDLLGLPMYFHSKNGQDFEFKYYADKNNKELYILGQPNSFLPASFGQSTVDNGKVVSDENAQPIVLPTKGYYKIKINPGSLTYTATPYTPTSKIWDVSRGNWLSGTEWNKDPYQSYFVGIAGEGFDVEKNFETWNAWNNTPSLRMTNVGANAYQLVGEMTVKTAGNIKITFTGQWWKPEWRLIKNGIATMTPGGNDNEPYPATPGVYKVVLDTELERAYITRK